MIPSSACQPWPPDQPGQAGIVVALGSYTTIRDTTAGVIAIQHEVRHFTAVQPRNFYVGLQTYHRATLTSPYPFRTYLVTSKFITSSIDDAIMQLLRDPNDDRRRSDERPLHQTPSIKQRLPCYSSHADWADDLKRRSLSRFSDAEMCIGRGPLAPR